LEELQSGGFTRPATEISTFGGALSGRTSQAIAHLEGNIGVRISGQRYVNEIPNADGHYVVFENPRTANGVRQAEHVMVATRRGDEITFFDPQRGVEVEAPGSFDAHAVDLYPDE